MTLQLYKNSVFILRYPSKCNILEFPLQQIIMLFLINDVRFLISDVFEILVLNGHLVANFAFSNKPVNIPSQLQ